jgi:hypothetical protein
MKWKQTWFTRQLELAVREVSTWSEWELKAAGLSFPVRVNPDQVIVNSDAPIGANTWRCVDIFWKEEID